MSHPLIRPGMTVLFQGDSITDAGRDRGLAEPNNVAAVGTGYACLAIARLLMRFGPNGVRCFNRGVSGEKAFDLSNRWQRDCLDVEPDVLSLLIGVNDTWHALSGTDANPEATLPRYAHHVDFLLGSVREQNPDAVLLVCDPFWVPAGITAPLPFEPELGERRDILGEAATKHDALRVRFQDLFDEQLAAGVPAESLAHDGVHPTLYGHAVMAGAWLEAVGL